MKSINQHDTTCPRCGKLYDHSRAGGSRVTPERDIDICGRCCTDEAVRGCFPVAEWPVQNWSQTIGLSEEVLEDLDIELNTVLREATSAAQPGDGLDLAVVVEAMNKTSVGYYETTGRQLEAYCMNAVLDMLDGEPGTFELVPARGANN